MGIVLETHGALKPATLNWLASQVRVRCFALLFSVNPGSGSGSLCAPCIVHLHFSFASLQDLRTYARLRLASTMKSP
jgi:hypothetical protein